MKLKLKKGDELLIKISKNEVLERSQMIITGFDPTVKYDTYYDPESSLDENKDDYKHY